MEVICKNCDCVFNKPPSHIKRVKNNFCSIICNNAYQKRIVTKNCIICNSAFNTRPSDCKKYSTCNNPICRKKNKTGANNPNWRGGSNKTRSKTITDRLRSSGKYLAWRNNILAICDNNCVICSSREQVHVHHVVPIFIMPELALHDSNGVVLCEYHHRLEHKRNMGRVTVVAVDLDGTLAYNYDGEFDPYKIGDPVPPMINRVRSWIDNGVEVRIFTARAQNHGNIKPIRDWLRNHGLPDLLITNKKTMDIDVIWDDKARQVIPNTGREVVGETSTSFSLMRKLRKDIDRKENNK